MHIRYAKLMCLPGVRILPVYPYRSNQRRKGLDMTTRIITKAQAHDMANQLASMGGIKETTETGIVVKTPKGKEAFRAMVGTGGTMLARWPDGLFDQV